MTAEDEVWFCWEESAGVRDEPWTFRFRRVVGSEPEEKEKTVQAERGSLRAGEYYDGNLKHLPAWDK